MANKAKKTPSGSWRVQVYDYTDQQGKKHVKSFTASTKAQAELMAAEFARTKRTRASEASKGTVGALIDKYIELCGPVLSPSTLTAYKRIRAHAFPTLMETQASKLNAAAVQKAINAETQRTGEATGKPLSAKTIKNEWGLVSAALAELTGMRFAPKLPTYQVVPKDLPEPAAVMAAVRGSDVELPVLLALCLSLTISEIRGLKCSDVAGGTLTIRRVIVDTDAGPVVKETGKTATRLRKLVIPRFLRELVESTVPYIKYAQGGSDGFLEPRSRAAIYGRFQTEMRRAGLKISFHGLRALNASAMLALGVPDKYAMERGGWRTPHVMKAHYQQTLSQERLDFDELVNDYFSEKYNFTDNFREATSLKNQRKS
ncbi:MAG: tyrosine-type recombinase/integrase [Firmicutes bacterium]|nr:tyrosine-type recombinase/integrase [Bacillota bacterium]